MPASEASERAASSISQSASRAGEHAVSASQLGGANLHGNGPIFGLAHEYDDDGGSTGSAATAR